MAVEKPFLPYAGIAARNRSRLLWTASIEVQTPGGPQIELPFGDGLDGLSAGRPRRVQ
jgi:hypothetical protein